MTARPGGEALRVAIVGCGERGRWLAQRLGDACTITALVDPDPATRDRMADAAPFALRAAAWSDAVAAAADAVVISSPSHRHAEQVRDALDAGCHVFCEKPLAQAASDAAALVEHAASRELLLTVGYDHEFESGFAAAMAAVDAGAVGRVEVVLSQTLQSWWAVAQGTWRALEEGPTAGMLGDTGSHVVELVVRRLGMPDRVEAAIGAVGGVPIRANVTLAFADGAQAYLQLSTRPGVDLAMEEQLHVIGTESEVIASTRHAALREADGTTRELPLPDVEPMVAVWASAVRTGERPAALSTASVDVLTVLQAIRDAADAHRAVRPRRHG